MEQTPSWEPNQFSTVKKFPAFYETRMFITTSQNARQLSFISYFLKIHFNIIFYLCPDLPSGVFPSALPTNIMYPSLMSLIHATYPAHFIIQGGQKVARVRSIA